MTKRSGQPVTTGNVMGECPACFRKIGDAHAEYCDSAWDELMQANDWFNKRAFGTNPPTDRDERS